VHADAMPAVASTPKAAKKKRRLSPEGREAIQEAFRRRWAQKRAEAEPSKPATKKGTGKRPPNGPSVRLQRKQQRSPFQRHASNLLGIGNLRFAAWIGSQRSETPSTAKRPSVRRVSAPLRRKVYTQ
jgi:hypothetical protein